MKKLMLDLETLVVDTFEPAESPGVTRGTVLAAQSGTLPICCVTFTCGDSHYRPCQAD